MKHAFPSLTSCFLFTLKQCVTNLACAPFFCFAILFYSFYYCWPYMEQLPDHLEVVVVDEDHSPLSRRLLTELKAATAINVAAMAADQPEAERMIRRGSVSSMIVIPPNFEKNTLNNTPTAVVVVSNGAFIVKARVATSGVSGPLQQIISASIAAHLAQHGIPIDKLQEAAARAPSLVFQPMFNTVNGYLNFTVPIVFIVIIQTVFVAGIGMLLNDWFWRKKYPYALACASRSLPHFLALFLPFFVLCFIWCMYIEGASFAYHGVNAFENISATLFTSLAYCFTTVSLGLFLGLLCKRTRYIVQIIVPSSIPSVFLSGNLFPWQNFPEPILIFSKLLPTTPATDAMMRASQAGADISQIFYPYIVHILLLGFIFFTAALLLIRRIADDPQTLAQLDDLKRGTQNEKLERELTPKEAARIESA